MIIDNEPVAMKRKADAVPTVFIFKQVHNITKYSLQRAEVKRDEVLIATVDSLKHLSFMKGT